MKKIAVYLLILPALVIVACGDRSKSHHTSPAVAVEVAKVGLADIVVTRSYSGTIEGIKQSGVYAAFPERVMEILVKEGEKVRQGQLLIVLDKAGANSRYNQALAVYNNAKDNFEKMRNLYQQQAISEMDYKRAKTSYEVAEADFIAAKETVELTSPIDGVVTDIAVNVGDQAPLGVPLVTVAATNKMRLTVFVNFDPSQLNEGDEVMVSAYPDLVVPGKITARARSADPETRLYRVEIEMENQEGRLRPGMFARVDMVVEQLRNVMAVSQRAIFNEDGVSKVYVVQNDTAYSRRVEIGPTDGKVTQVISGLSLGQQVVIEGISNLRDATPVVVTSRENSDVSG